MPRQARQLAVGRYYHLYNRGNNHQAIFFERENYGHFLRLFRHYVAARIVQVTAYCLMPNHYHFLIFLRESGLSKAMQRFVLAYTHGMNHRYGRSGTLFQGRFQTKEVDRDEYLLHLTRYIHLNPVKAGLVQCPEDWEFSSYQDYVGLRRGTLPRSAEVLAQVGDATAYRQFVAVAAEPQVSIQHLLLD